MAGHNGHYCYVDVIVDIALVCNGFCDMRYFPGSVVGEDYCVVVVARLAVT